MVITIALVGKFLTESPLKARGPGMPLAAQLVVYIGSLVVVISVGFVTFGAFFLAFFPLAVVVLIRNPGLILRGNFGVVEAISALLLGLIVAGSVAYFVGKALWSL
jgi:hypothetical protein